MKVARTPAGNRHHVEYRFVGSLNFAFIQAACVCGEPVGPPRFGRERAEEDARQHMQEYAKQGKPKRGAHEAQPEYEGRDRLGPGRRDTAVPGHLRGTEVDDQPVVG